MLILLLKSFGITWDIILNESNIHIDRPKGTAHPDFRDTIYSVNYGYLENTKSMDGEEIDLFLGDEKIKNVDSIAITVDLLKRDS